MHRRWICASFCFSASILFAAPQTEITFNKDVLPILQNRCQGCHRPGEAAPMAFLTYSDTRPWAAAIRQAVQTGKMPPWHADPAHGRFLNDRRLTAAEKETLVEWTRTGAREGDPKLAPPLRQFTERWTIGQPDLVFDMGTDYRVPAKGTVEYTYFVVPTGFKEDKWVEKIEVRPGARSVVHHIVMIARAPGSEFAKGAKPGEPFVPPQNPDPPKRKPDTGDASFFGIDPRGGSEIVSVYVPGGDAYVTRPGQARLIKAGSDLIFQMHYTANGTEAVDRSQVGIVFAKEPPKERVVNTFVENTRLHIPPGEPNHRIDGRVKIYEDVKLQAFFPHMHLRGKAMEYRAIYPSGEKEILLSVPKYDFNWQMTYEPVEPLLLPKGSTLDVSAWYDNSPNNPANPDPKADVYWGDQSWEEMFAAFVDLVIPVSMNPASVAMPPKPVKTAADSPGAPGRDTAQAAAVSLEPTKR
jgi:hypothetical protein